MKNIYTKCRIFYTVLFVFSIVFSINSDASSSGIFKSPLLEKQNELPGFTKINRDSFYGGNYNIITFSSSHNGLLDIYSSYRYALDWFHKGNPQAAINELNTNCIPNIPANNSFIYKAYKLLITCYQNIDKDGIAQEKLSNLCAAVKMDKNRVQQILSNTSL
jgi:hypothetical protein